jgi:PAS domain S-box-containing protein
VVDINDQKVREDQLRYQANVLENVLDIIVTTDLNFIVKSWNKIAESEYEIAQEYAVGKRFLELIDFKFLNDTKENSIEKLETEGIWKGEVVYKNKQGQSKYFVHTVTYFYNELGEKIGIMAVGRDFTDRKLAEENLQRSEQFYRSLIADSLDGILLLNSFGTITFVSPSITHILGYDAEKVREQNVFNFVHPDDQLWASRSFQREVSENPVVQFIVVRLRKKNGEWIWCTVRGHNLLSNPYVNSIVIYFHDDTLRKNASDALKASEHRFRTLISDIQIGVILYDNHGKIIMCNKVVQDMHNTSEQELINKDIYEVIEEAVHEDGRRFLPEEKPLYHVLKYKQTVKDVVMGIRLAHNKELVWLLIHTDPILDEAGNIIHIISSLKDITERKKLEQRLMHEQIGQQKALTQATIDAQEKERKEIGKELHDNIGQQLTTTKLYLDLANSSIDEAAREMVTLSLKSISGLINEVRDMSRSLMPPTLGDLGLIDSIYDLIETINRTQPLIIKLDHSGFIEEKIAGNQKLMIFRIVQEQLNNILKHAAAKNVTIKVQNNKPLLFLEIRDDGNGFDIVKTRKGLGLTNIKNRAELFGGNVEILSAAGKGCAIKVTIPDVTAITSN